MLEAPILDTGQHNVHDPDPAANWVDLAHPAQDDVDGGHDNLVYAVHCKAVPCHVEGPTLQGAAVCDPGTRSGAPQEGVRLGEEIGDGDGQDDTPPLRLE